MSIPVRIGPGRLPLNTVRPGPTYYAYVISDLRDQGVYTFLQAGINKQYNELHRDIIYGIFTKKGSSSVLNSFFFCI